MQKNVKLTSFISDNRKKTIYSPDNSFVISIFI